MNQIELKNLIRVRIDELLKEKSYVSSVDLLMKLNYLSKSDYDNWRFGKVGYLEKVCKVNLSKLSFINGNLERIGKELNLKESWTGYIKYGKGQKMKLRFSKSNDDNTERRYATHYVLR